MSWTGRSAPCSKDWSTTWPTVRLRDGQDDPGDPKPGRCSAAADDLRRLGRAPAGQAPELAWRIDPQQVALLAAMRAALARMLQWEGFQETVTMLREILRLQAGLNAETIEEIERQAADVVEDELEFRQAKTRPGRPGGDGAFLRRAERITGRSLTPHPRPAATDRRMGIMSLDSMSLDSRPVPFNLNEDDSRLLIPLQRNCYPARVRLVLGSTSRGR